MRLSEKNRLGIIEALDDFLGSHQADLKLFGSRVDPEAKGGDIDLILIVDSNLKSMLSPQKAIILSRIKSKIGDQKIDLNLRTQSEIQGDPFWEQALENSIQLKFWSGSS